MMLKLQNLRIVVPMLAIFTAHVSVSPADTVSTIFDTDTPNFGAAFDVINLSGSPINLTGKFEGNFHGGYGGFPQPFPDVEIWWHSDSLTTSILESASGWSLLGTHTSNSEPNPRGTPTPIEVGNILSLAPGETKGIYMAVRGDTNQQPKPLYYSVLPQKSVFDDGILQITNFFGMGFSSVAAGTYPAADNNDIFDSGRVWNGSVEYDAGPVVPASVFTWQADDVGNWADSNNWSFSPPASNGTANNGNHTAIFGSATSTNTTVVTNASVTLNRIEFNSSTNSYVLAGSGSVNLADTTATNSVDPSMTVLGTHEFQAGVNLMANASVDVASNSTLTFNNALRLMGNTLTKNGDGTMDINNVLSLGGGTIDIQQGSVSGHGTIGGDVNNNGGTISPGDSLQQTSAVPEPASLVLFMLGTVGVVTLQHVCRKRDR